MRRICLWKMVSQDLFPIANCDVCFVHWLMHFEVALKRDTAGPMPISVPPPHAIPENAKKMTRETQITEMARTTRRTMTRRQSIPKMPMMMSILTLRGGEIEGEMRLI